MKGFRVGQGFDVHAFMAGEAIVLGGVRIPFEHAFRAHSDGDVLLHAICDALLGAAALNDIGHHYPDTDPRWQGVDSRELLRDVRSKLAALDWVCINVDSTIVAQAPRLAPHVDTMAIHIAEDLGLDRTAVNVKATTSEQLGFCGRGEGIAAMATVLLSTS